MTANFDNTKAARLAGYSDNRDSNDFYETPIEDVSKFIKAYLSDLNRLGTVLEPSAGGGNIIKGIQAVENNTMTSYKTNDIVARDYPLTWNEDFLTLDSTDKDYFNTVITNPPYKYAKEFILKSFEFLADRESSYSSDCVIMLLRLQFLEGINRQQFLKKYLSEVYVSSSRINCRSEEMQKSDKKATSTLAMGWFIFRPNIDKSENPYPIIKFL